MMQDVAVLGVGMARFGMWADRSNADLGREAGLAALRDAGLSFRDVQAAYVGHIFAPVFCSISRKTICVGPFTLSEL